MQDNKEIRKSAFLYFGGRASADDEERLHDFVSSSDDNRRQFSEWERQWTEESVPSSDTVAAWEQLRQRLDTRTTQPTVRKATPTAWMRVALYAAAAAVLAMAVITTTLLLKNNAVGQSPIACSTPQGSRSQLTLPDGTKVWLNVGSEISCGRHFADGDRKVTLSGEAYFEVAHHEGSTFTVATGCYDVTVHGTKFNVTSYPDDPTVTTTLLEGSVDIHRGQTVVEMKPGEKVVYDRATRQLTKSEATGDARSWTGGALECERVTLRQFAGMLSRRYAVDVKIADERTAGMKVSVILQNNESIDEVLSALRQITGCSVTRDGKVVTIR